VSINELFLFVKTLLYNIPIFYFDLPLKYFSLLRILCMRYVKLMHNCVAGPICWFT
jgi:hypothetical protein